MKPQKHIGTDFLALGRLNLLAMAIVDGEAKEEQLYRWYRASPGTRRLRTALSKKLRTDLSVVNCKTALDEARAEKVLWEIIAQINTIDGGRTTLKMV